LDIFSTPSVPGSSLAVGALDVAPQQQVEGLVGAAEFHVGVDRHRVVALQQRVEQLEHRDRLARAVTLGEVIALEHLGHGGGAGQAEQFLGRHVQPFAVVAHLEALVLGEDVRGLAAEGLGVAVDLRAGEHRAGLGAPAGVPHTSGVVADDEHDDVPGVLELPQLL
jgi:hypothetical protein